MNGSRRAGHRRLVLLLAPIAGLIVLASYVGRSSDARVAQLPDFSAGSHPELGSLKTWGEPLWIREDLFPNWPARLMAYPGNRFELKPLRALGAPDVLLYWTPEESWARAESGFRLPDDVHLLGRIGGTGSRRFILPAHAEGGGSFVLYSLGHQEVVTLARLPDLDPRSSKAASAGEANP